MNFLRMSRVSVAVGALVMLFVVAIAVIATSLVRQRHVAALEDNEAQAVRFISGAEAAVNRSLLGLDVMLASMDKLLNVSAGMREWLDTHQTSQLMQHAMRQNLLASRVALVDAVGQTIASSDNEVSPSDWRLPEEFLRMVLTQPLSSLMISAPGVSFRSGETVLYVGRYLKFADGTRLVAVAEVAIGQLNSVLAQGAGIAGLQATMERANGELLVASPLSEEMVGKMLTPALASISTPAPRRDMLARLGREPAILVVRNTMYHDIVLTASIPLHTALQDVERETLLISAIAVGLAVMLLVAGGGVLWYTHWLRANQASMAEAKNALDQALESMVSGFVLLDNQQRIVNWNRRFMELHPWLEGLVGPQVSFRMLAHTTALRLLPDATEVERSAWVENRVSMLGGQLESRQVTTQDGQILEISERPTPDGGTVIVYQDVTRLHRAIADVETLAFYDPLTALPNRRLLNDRLQQALISSLRTGRLGALLFLDLDHFKTLNDTAGHLVGDMLLQQVARRLQAAVREEDTVARLGGDEFVVMLQNLSVVAVEAATQTKVLAENILANLNQPYVLQDTQHTSTCSVGATLFGDVHEEAGELLKRADIAMYAVKTTGRNGLCFFDPKMLDAITVRAELERDLRHALAESQFALHFQVQVADQGCPIGAEVLIRWQHPVKGLVAPLQFIGLAEETGLIIPIGEWVLQTACQQLRRWESDPIATEFQLAVNVSARQFRAADFVERVRAILAETGARAGHLKLELTESMVLDNVKDAIEKMHSLKTLGVRLAMDDFGTGYSSLSYLTRLPLDQLKIDQSFVRNIGAQTSDSVVIDTIIGLAKSLHLEVIAEGVETTEQRDFLAAHGCKFCQGYLFGRPVPIADFEASLLSHEIAL
jgi:diguanylate cyclase (GGDEF)-like protein